MIITKEELKNRIETDLKHHFDGSKGKSLSYAELDLIIIAVDDYKHSPAWTEEPHRESNKE